MRILISLAFIYSIGVRCQNKCSADSTLIELNTVSKCYRGKPKYNRPVRASALKYKIEAIKQLDSLYEAKWLRTLKRDSMISTPISTHLPSKGSKYHK